MKCEKRQNLLQSFSPFWSCSFWDLASSTTEYVREGSVPANPETDQFLVLPAYIGVPGDDLALSAALFGGVVAAFGDQAVSLQPLQPLLDAAGLGWIFRSMAYGIHHMVTFHEVFDFAEDAGFHGGTSEYGEVLDVVGEVVNLATNELGLDFNPKYLVVASIYSYGGLFGLLLDIRTLGAIYNLEEQKVDKVVIMEQTTFYNEVAMLAELATLGDKLYGVFFPSEEEEEA